VYELATKRRANLLYDLLPSTIVAMRGPTHGGGTTLPAINVTRLLFDAIVCEIVCEALL
jgi:hypothetical protein